VNRPNQNFRGFSGTIVSGTVKTGDAIKVLPSARSSVVDRVVTYDGDLDEYRAMLGGRRPREAAAPTAKPSERRDRAESRTSLAPLRERLRKLEAEIAKLEAEAKTIDSALADPRLYASNKTDLIARATARRGEIGHRLPRLEAEWLELQEKLEAA
jgi:ATP-binding cassette subfamily F protein 3